MHLKCSWCVKLKFFFSLGLIFIKASTWRWTQEENSENEWMAWHQERAEGGRGELFNVLIRVVSLLSWPFSLAHCMPLRGLNFLFCQGRSNFFLLGFFVSFESFYWNFVGLEKQCLDFNLYLLLELLILLLKRFNLL